MIVFDYLVTVFVSGILAIVILVAVIRLTGNVFQLFQQQLTNHTDFMAFQTTFGMLLTLLIAFEFRHSLNAIIREKELADPSQNRRFNRYSCPRKEIFSA